MTLRFRHTLTPCIEPVASEQKTVRRGILLQGRFNHLNQSGGVLTILENWQPFPMLVGANTFKPLEHLETFETHTSIGRRRVRN